MAGARELFRLVGKIALDGSVKLDEDLKRLDKSAGKLGASLNKMGKQLTTIGMTLTKSVTAPIMAGVATVTKFGADFDKAMAESTAIITNLSDEMRDKMADTARDVATSTRFSAAQAAQAYLYLASAGLNAQQSIAALPKVANFAQAANVDMAMATSLLADAQSALGLKTADAAENMENMVRVSDTLIRANVLANGSAIQFSEALTNKAGAALKMVNKDIEEGVAVLAAYADQGIKGAEAGTQFSIVMRDLQKLGIKNAEAFMTAGIAIYDTNGKMRNMADIIFDLENRLSGMSDEQKRAELMALGFADRSVMAMLALVGTSDAIKQYEADLRSAGGETERVAQNQLRNFWDMLNLIKNKLVDVALTLWENLKPVMTDVVIPALEVFAEKLKVMAEWFGNLDPPMQKTIISLIAMAAAYGPVMLAAGKLSSLFGVLIPLIAKLVTGQLTLNAAMAANPIGIIITAVFALVAAFVALYNNNEKFREGVITVWTAIKDFIVSVVEFLTPIFKPFVDAVKLHFFAIWDVVKIVWNQITNYFVMVFNVIKNLFKAFTSILSGDWQSAWEAIGNIVDVVIDFVLKTWSNFKLAFLRNLSAIVDAVYNFVKDVPFIGDAMAGIKESIDRVFNDAQIEAAEKYGFTLKRVKEETKKANDDLKVSTDELANATVNLNDVEADLIETQEEQAKTTLDQIKAAEKLAEEREKFEQEWTNKLFQQTSTRAEILEKEKQDALAKAEELGADKQAVLDYYQALEEQKAEEWRLKNEEKKMSEKERLILEMEEELKQVGDNEEAKYQIRQYYSDKLAELNKEAHKQQLETFLSYVDALASGEKTLKDILKEIVINQITSLQQSAIAEFLKGVATAWAQAPATFGASLSWLAPLAAQKGIAIAGLEAVKAVVRGLAEGGVVKKPTFAVIGEGADEEAVLPLNRRTYSALGRGIVEHGGVGSGGYRTANIYLTLDGRTLAHAIGRPLADTINIKTGSRQ